MRYSMGIMGTREIRGAACEKAWGRAGESMGEQGRKHGIELGRNMERRMGK